MRRAALNVSALVVTASLFVVTCSNEADKPAEVDADDTTVPGETTDTPSDAAPTDSVQPVPDAAPPVDQSAGSEVDAPSDAGSRTSPDDDVVSAACADGAGCFGDPCETDDDCYSGVCIEHLGDTVCSKTCSEECPVGWTCEQMVGPSGDPTFICVSSFEHLCRPCMNNADCTSETSEAACIDYDGQGGFCGAVCDADTDCPEGFACQASVSTRGGSSDQCVDLDGICDCSSLAIDLGLVTTCSVTNSDGLCEGLRACTEAGLTACDAATPAPEVCNGLDDDCDGETDEVDCDDQNACTTDLCDGEAGCTNTATDGAPCDDLDPSTGGDACTSEGACIGEAIVCPESPCILEATANGVDCDVTYKDQGTACDDGNANTRDDACTTEGLCKGDEYSCEATQCELSSVPDGVDCAVLAKEANTECDDGDPTTQNDVCNGAGGCVGTPYTCEPSECEVSSEPDGVGCAVIHKDAGTACGEAATECSGQDTCDGNGACVLNDLELGAACGDSGSECVLQDTCNGVGDCTDHGFWTAGLPCGDSATDCSDQDTCDHSGVCLPNHLDTTTQCGDAGAECVNQDTCDGSGACTDNGYWGVGASCGDPATECSGQDTCDPSGVCVTNHLDATTHCGDAGAECVNQDTCDGSGACTDNGYWDVDASCGDPATECSGQDTCDESGQCLPNHVDSGAQCGDAAADCVHKDTCDGLGGCTDHGFWGEGLPCGAVASECSGQDTCDDAGQCLANHLATTTLCGDAGADCINQDTCDGAGGCADNGYWDTGMNCGDAATPCSGQDTCDPSGVCLPNHLDTSTQCGDAGADCINQDTCDGSGGCADKGYWDVGTSCGDAATPCSGQDTCDGDGACLGNDLDPHPVGYDPSCSVVTCPANAQGAPACVCDAGYSDELTWNAATYAWDGGCHEINECADDPCGAGGTCTDQLNAFSCSCDPGYQGGGTNTACTLVTCPPAASGAPVCSCDDGYSGSLTWTTTTSSWEGSCSDIDECATNNGDCGDAQSWDCTNNVGAAPTCTLVNGLACIVGGTPCTSGYCYEDSDGDRYDPGLPSPSAKCQPAPQLVGVDCDDTCATCFPGSTVTTSEPDGLDQDCDGSLDDYTGTPSKSCDMNIGSPDNYIGYGTCPPGEFLPGTDIPNCNFGTMCNGWYNGGFNASQILNANYGNGTGMIDGCDKYCYENDPATTGSWPAGGPDAGDGPSNAPVSTSSVGLGGFIWSTCTPFRQGTSAPGNLCDFNDGPTYRIWDALYGNKVFTCTCKGVHTFSGYR